MESETISPKKYVAAAMQKVSQHIIQYNNIIIHF